MNDKSTRQLVFETATQMFVTEGVKPSVTTIRARIGHGSNSTIQSALNAWWKETASSLRAAQQFPDGIPGDVSARVSEAFKGFWEAANAAAAAKFKAGESDNALRLNAALADIQKLESMLVTLQKNHMECNKALDRARTDLSQESARRAGLEVEIAAEKAKTTAFSEEIVSLRAMLAETRKAHADALEKMRKDSEVAVEKAALRFEGLQREVLAKIGQSRPAN
jgi:hypothetical protein